MATTKEYKDLNPAAEIAPEALVALAQPGKSELETTTVEELSAAVADTLQNGALAELESAVSLGKRELAQRLQEKGSEGASAGETLIQLADRLNNLAIDGEKNNLLGQIVMLGESESIPSTRKPFNFRFLKNGYVAIAAGANLYLVPPGKYDSLEEMISAAVAQTAFQSTGAYTYIGRSQDGNTLICVAGNYTYEIYDVNYDTPALTFIKSISGVYANEFSQHPGLAISNDRTLCTGQIVSYNANLYLFKTDDTAVQVQIDAGLSSSKKIRDVMFDEEANRVFFAGNVGLYAYDYSVTEGAITGTQSKIRSNSYARFIHECYAATFVSSSENQDVQDGITTPRIHVLELRNSYKQLSLPLKQVMNAWGDTGQYMSKVALMPAGCLNYPVKQEGSKYQLMLPGHIANEIVYDAEAHTLTKKYDYVNAINQKWVYSNGLITMFHCIAESSGGVLCFPGASNAVEWNGLGTIANWPISGVKVIGQQRQVNGGTVNMVMPIFPNEAVEAGYYDQQTRTVELEPEAEQ